MTHQRKIDRRRLMKAGMGGAGAAAVAAFIGREAATAPSVASANMQTGVQGGRARFYPSIWPHGRSDTWRTGAAIGAGLPAGFDPAALTTTSVELPNVPVWGVVYAEDAVFVQGGSPFLLDIFSNPTAADAGTTLDRSTLAKEGAEAAKITPYVARIDPRTMEVTGVTEFPAGKAFNYLGVVLIHENGMLYTVNMATLYEVDPGSMEITRSLALPTYDPQPEQTLYNSIQIAPTSGDLITKATSAAGQTQPAKLVAVNLDDFSVRFQSDVSTGATRLGVASTGGKDYVYASDNTNSQRFEIAEAEFVTDEAWSKAYQAADSGATGGVGMVYMGDQEYVVFPNNNTVIFGVTAPLQFFVQSTVATDAGVIVSPANSSGDVGGSFYAASADPFNTGVFAVNDQINGILTGWRLQDDGAPVNLWETDQYRSSAGSAIGSDQGHLYIDDLRCDASGENCETHLVILDLESGEQLGEVLVEGTFPSLGQTFLSENEVFFIAAEAGLPAGYVTKVSIGPEPMATPVA